MCDEGQTYICFCALMKRLKMNFMIDGISMTKKFSHLSDALQFYDYEFYCYLKKQQADDLLFCYRWLLLEMKREFAFEDSLRMLEVLWSSLPPDPPEKELMLFEKEFVPSAVEIPAGPKSPLPVENAYTKVCALRRQNSAMSISNAKLDVTRRMNQSLDETKSERSEIKRQILSLDESKLQEIRNERRREDKQVTTPEDKTESPQEASVASDNSDENKNPFLYSDSTDADLPSGSSITSSPLKTITRGNSISETLKELRDKLVASKIGIVSTIEKLEEDYDPKNAPEVKLVKNFNEFLNFAKRRSSNASQPDQPQNQLTVDRQTKEISPDDSQDYYPITTSVTRGLKLELENLNRQVFGSNFQNVENETSPGDIKLSECLKNVDKHPYIQLDVDAIEVDTGQEVEKVKMRKSRRDKEETAVNRFSVASSTNNDVFIWQNPLHASSDFLQTTPDEQTDLEFDAGEIIEMDHGKKSVSKIF
jgi:hypothetical protein